MNYLKSVLDAVKLQTVGCWLVFAFVMFAGECRAEANWSAPQVLDVYVYSESTNNLTPRVARSTTGTLMSIRRAGGQHSGNTARRIIATYSTDSGASWSSATLVNAVEISSQSTTYKSEPVTADVVYAGDNTWVCQWISFVNPNTGSWYYVVNSVRSVDNGRSWTDLSTTVVPDMNHYSYNPIGLRMASDGAGTLISTWTLGLGVGGRMWTNHSVDYGKSWTQRKKLESLSQLSIESRIAYSGIGTWLHAYSYRDPASTSTVLVVDRSTDSGNNWTSETISSSSDRQVILGDLKTTSDTLAVAFTVTNTSGVQAIIRYSTDDGITWQESTAFHLRDRRTLLSLATGDSGDWALSVADRQAPQGPERDLSLLHASNLDGEWTSTTLHAPPDGQVELPELVPTADGLFLCLYQETLAYGDGYVAPWYVRALKSAEGTAVWTQVPFPNEHSPFYYSGNYDQKFNIGVSSDGTFVVTWLADVDATAKGIIRRLFPGATAWSSPEILPPGRTELKYLGGSSWLQFTVPASVSNTYQTNITHDNGVTWEPSHPTDIVKSAGDGTVLRMYKSGNSYYVTTSQDFGRTWSSPVPFASAIHSLAHSVGSTWYHRRGYNYYKSEDDGLSWFQTNVYPELAQSDHRGNFVVGHSRYLPAEGSADYEVRVARWYEDGHTTYPVLALDTAPTYDDRTFRPYHLTVETAYLGGEQWIIVYEKLLERPSSTGWVNYASARLFYTLSYDGGRTWDTPQQLVDDDELPPGTGQIYPTVAAKDGSVIVGWQVVRDTGPGIDPLEEFAYVVGDIPVVPPAAIGGWELY